MTPLGRTIFSLSALASLLLGPLAAAAAAAPAGDDAAVERQAMWQRAEQAEATLEFEEASLLWQELVARPDLGDDERVLANYKAGEMARVLERDVEARMHFKYVLEQRPDYAVPQGAPPKVRWFFELVRQDVQGQPRTPDPAPATNQPSATREVTAPETTPWMSIAGGASAGLGVLVAAAGILAGLSAQTAHQEALAEPGQLTAVQRYRERDNLALLANLGYGASALLALTGGGLLTADLLLGGE